MSTFKMIIDPNERALISEFRSDQLKKECSHVQFLTENLTNGDVIYKLGDQIVCLVERKAVADYASSITDKRSKEQAMRIASLKVDNPEMLVIYMIEGGAVHKDKKFHNGIDRNRLYSSIVHKLLRDKFVIWRTTSLEDSVLFLTKLYDEIPHYANLSELKPHEERLEYLKNIKLAKKDNMTPENCYLCQLATIPGISIDLSNTISQKYFSMAQLILSYEKLTAIKDKENMLAELSVPIANEKTKRFGNVLSKRVYDYLYPQISIPVPVPVHRPKQTIKLKTIQ